MAACAAAGPPPLPSFGDHSLIRTGANRPLCVCLCAGGIYFGGMIFEKQDLSDGVVKVGTHSTTLQSGSTACSII